MESISGAFKEAFHLLVRLDSGLLDIVSVSLKVSLTSTVIATMIGVPLGTLLVVKSFRGNQGIITVLSSLMSMPTVVIGLLVYSFLSRSGPLGRTGLLYTLTAMVIGQVLLALPIVISLSVTAVRTLDSRVQRTLSSFGATGIQTLAACMREARYGLIAAVIAGFGRVFAEIGVSMMLGGNIEGYTRNITTAIALETSKGEIGLGIALGLILLTIAFTLNGLFNVLQRKSA